MGRCLHEATKKLNVSGIACGSIFRHRERVYDDASSTVHGGLRIKFTFLRRVAEGEVA
jgi:hypothetical protein